jgi:hypothetical protein
MRYLRLLTKSAAAMEIGTEGLVLVMVVAGQEDACRYARPVNFWNRQLAVLCGIPAENEKQLRRVRDRCVAAGWLHYESLGKRKHGRYFVVIPDHVNQDNDGSCDESPRDDVRQMPANCPPSVRQVSVECPPSVRQVSVECPPSIPFPNPNPNPIPSPHTHAASEPADTPFDVGPTPPIPDAARWAYVRAEPWARDLVAAGAKIGPNAWPTWKRLADTHGLPLVLAALATVDPTERFADQVEQAIIKRGAQAATTPMAVAAKRKELL